MKILIEESVLRHALGALESSFPQDQTNGDAWIKRKEAITALRTALDAAEGVNPVAECVNPGEPYCWMLDTAEPIGTTPVSFTYQPKWGFTFPLYTHHAPAIPEAPCPKCAAYETAIREMIDDVTRKFGIDSPAVPEDEIERLRAERDELYRMNLEQAKTINKLEELFGVNK